AAIGAVLNERGYCLGCTATPLRLDGKPLDFFQTMVLGPSYDELYAGGWLVRATTFAPRLRLDLSGVKIRAGDWVASELAQIMQRSEITGDIVQHYLRHASDATAICYCCNREHSRMTVKAFQAADVSCVHVDGESSDSERQAALKGIADRT